VVFKFIYFWHLRRCISEMPRPITVKLLHMIGRVGT